MLPNLTRVKRAHLAPYKAHSPLLTNLSLFSSILFLFLQFESSQCLELFPFLTYSETYKSRVNIDGLPRSVSFRSLSEEGIVFRTERSIGVEREISASSWLQTVHDFVSWWGFLAPVDAAVYLMQSCERRPFLVACPKLVDLRRYEPSYSKTWVEVFIHVSFIPLIF